MIEITEIKKLAQLRTKENHLIFSLYLNTNRKVDQRKSYLVVFKDLAKEALQEIKDEKGRKDLEKDLQRIENFLNYEFSQRAKGLFIYSCVAENIWGVVELPIEVYNQYFLARSPYIGPLVSLLENYERFCTLLVDKEKARIFSVYLGRIEEHLNIFDEVVGKHKQGGSSEARFQRHHEDEVHRHLKGVAETLFHFFKKKHFSRLIIGYTSPEIWTGLESCLHPWLKEKIVAKFDVEMFASAKQILDKVLPIEEKIEHQKEEELVKLLEDNLGPSKKAVVGLYNVLFELQEGKVNLLIINEDYKHQGRECLRCKYLDAGEEEECPLCGSSMRRIKNVVEKAVKKALEQNIKIEFTRSKILKSLGEIGALLRF